MGKPCSTCLRSGTESIERKSKFFKKLEKSPEEKKFDALVKEVQWPKKYERPVSFAYPNLPSINKFITDAQKVINDALLIRLKLAEAIEKVMRDSGAYKIKNCKTSHAIIGIIYAIFVHAVGIDIQKLFSYSSKFPYLKFDIQTSYPIQIKTLAGILSDYVEIIEEATKIIPDFLEKTKDLALEAVTLKKKVKKDLSNISKMDEYQGIKATKALDHNVMALKKCYKFAKDTSKMIEYITVDLFQAVEVIVEDEAKLILRVKTLSDKGVSSPVDCYKHFNDWEESIQTADETLAYLYDFSKLKEEEEDEDELENQTEYDSSSEDQSL